MEMIAACDARSLVWRPMHASDDARFCSSKRGCKPSRVTQQQCRLRLGAEEWRWGWRGGDSSSAAKGVDAGGHSIRLGKAAAAAAAAGMRLVGRAEVVAAASWRAAALALRCAALAHSGRCSSRRCDTTPAGFRVPASSSDNSSTFAWLLPHVGALSQPATREHGIRGRAKIRQTLVSLRPPACTAVSGRPPTV